MHLHCIGPLIIKNNVKKKERMWYLWDKALKATVLNDPNSEIHHIHSKQATYYAQNNALDMYTYINIEYIKLITCT